ncbi:MAG: 5'/3'-nucleotidase SurE [Leucothrix sp.]
MKILLSNDDGYFAPGLVCLRNNLERTNELLTVAPNRNRSGASNSLTLDSPLRLQQHENHFYSVDGTPTDCVHLALTGLYTSPPDLVVAGINAGANLGDDVIYSGTVAAATEGRNLGLPAVAVSCCAANPSYFQTAADVVLALLPKLSDLNVGVDTILNINVPDIPWSDIKGFKVTKLGKRHVSKPAVKTQDPRGRDMYWVGPVGDRLEDGEGTDFHAVENGYVSITPLHIDLTQYQAMSATAQWLEGM